MKLNTIYENNGHQCCKDLKKMEDQFTKLLIQTGNHNVRTRNSFNDEKSNENMKLKRNLMKIKSFGYNTASAKTILKILKKTNVNMNKKNINKHFTKKGTLRSNFKVVKK